MTCVEHYTLPLLGWAVFAGCEGEDPSLVSFHLREEDADAVCMNTERTDCAAVLALVNEHGLFAANDWEIKSHDELAVVVAAYLEEMEDE
jgi:hypothetical protein